ncbi:hypothetical protein SCOR_19800 [Sulfidibacter corallicola]|uniref:Uncharacterized protein n=1 Tax=Sulfidibacter corallicola TaxID=2818388 RepID=A0A8A4TWH1_SULCO|nr:hypothetical protein [Sulfidibacter corallicola]QTD53312.1 hypothetical protein J3U87_12725 [Sulfidibacter corallicola]
MQATVDCKRCSARILPEHLDLDRGIAHCASCGAVFSLEATLDAAVTPGMDIRRSESGLSLTRRWYLPRHWLLMLLALVWNGFFLLWLARTPGFDPLLRLMAGVNLGFGFILFYGALVFLVNRTSIEVDSGRLRLRHGPFPWRRGLSVEIAQIDQLYCSERLVRRRGRAFPVYQVNIFLNNGERRLLLREIYDVNQALYVENQIERFLGIQDRPILGEVKK